MFLFNLFNNKLLNPLKENPELNTILMKEEKLNTNKQKNKLLNKLNKLSLNIKMLKENILKEFLEKL